MRLEDPAAAAATARLRYVTATAPGILRIRRGRGFGYRTADGRPVRDRAVLERIEALVIPPAWDKVWVCADPHGHIQAIGYDQKGRKQYRYHPDWTRVRNLAKFDLMGVFGASLPAIRRRVEADLLLPGLPKDKVCACVVHLMDVAMIRVGNSEYARDNDSYGLTTIRNTHARVRGAEVRLCFRAKSGRECQVSIESPRAAAVVRRCQELPGQELFGYVAEDGAPKDIGSGDVNEYLHRVSGEPVTAKDFRTWGGTVVALRTLRDLGSPIGPDGRLAISQRELKKREVAAVKAAASALCNTPATCRKFYVHPALIDAYADGSLDRALDAAKRLRGPRELRPSERALLRWLNGRKGASRAAG